jgi:hypothetical protein
VGGLGRYMFRWVWRGRELSFFLVRRAGWGVGAGALAS